MSPLIPADSAPNGPRVFVQRARWHLLPTCWLCDEDPVTATAAAWTHGDPLPQAPFHGQWTALYFAVIMGQRVPGKRFHSGLWVMFHVMDHF